MCVYMYMYIYIYIMLNFHTHIHTHIHIYTQAQRAYAELETAQAREQKIQRDLAEWREFTEVNESTMTALQSALKNATTDLELAVCSFS